MTKVANTVSTRVAIFDDVVAMRGETFHIPGLVVDVYGHADDAVRVCNEHAYDVVCMDYAMGAEHQPGDRAVAELRAGGFRGRIIGISSDPDANQAMRRAGADESLAKKAHLRSFLVRLGADPTVHADGSRGPGQAEGGDHADGSRGQAGGGQPGDKSRSSGQP
jgi:CheY-like chemotaxis protein